MLAIADLPTETVVVVGHVPQGITFANWVSGIVGIINNVVIPLLFACAFVAFLWGVFNYFILHAGSEEGRHEGRQFVFWGLIGMVVLFSVWGIVKLLLSTFGLA